MTTELEKTIEVLVLESIYNPKSDLIALEARLNELLQKISSESRTKAVNCLMTIVKKYKKKTLMDIPIHVMKDSLFPYMSTRDLSRFLTVNRHPAEDSDLIQPQMDRRKKVYLERKKRLQTALAVFNSSNKKYKARQNSNRVLKQEIKKGATFRQIKPYLRLGKKNYYSTDYHEDLLSTLMKREYDLGVLSLDNIFKFFGENQIIGIQNYWDREKVEQEGHKMLICSKAIIRDLIQYIIMKDYERGIPLTEIYSKIKGNWSFNWSYIESPALDRSLLAPVLSVLIEKEAQKGVSLFQMIPMTYHLKWKQIKELINLQYKEGILTMDQIQTLLKNYQKEIIDLTRDDPRDKYLDQLILSLQSHGQKWP
uniref:Uncharacterized protein n=1 Tax=viral metagenome TaxID=1070528 RepID=A0A6C0K2V2_9ZZZZ